MAYEIRIKGRNNILVVNTDVGRRLQDDWENYHKTKQDVIIKRGDWTGRVSDIKDFTHVPDNASQKENKELQKSLREYWDDVRLARMEAPEVRAQRISFFKFVYFVYTGKSPDQGICEKAIEAQKVFFIENPRRTVVNPIIFKPLVKEIRHGFEEKEGLRKLPVIRAGIRMIENMVKQDMDQAKLERI